MLFLTWCRDAPLFNLRHILLFFLYDWAVPLLYRFVKFHIIGSSWMQSNWFWLVIYWVSSTLDNLAWVDIRSCNHWSFSCWQLGLFLLLSIFISRNLLKMVVIEVILTILQCYALVYLQKIDLVLLSFNLLLVF